MTEITAPETHAARIRSARRFLILLAAFPLILLWILVVQIRDPHLHYMKAVLVASASVFATLYFIAKKRPVAAFGVAGGLVLSLMIGAHFMISSAYHDASLIDRVDRFKHLPVGIMCLIGLPLVRGMSAGCFESGREDLGHWVHRLGYILFFGVAGLLLVAALLGFPR